MITGPRAARRASLAVAVLLLVAAASASAQETLDQVRQLYGAAQYEKALAALTRLSAEPGTTAVVEIDQYRVLCLMALGRTKEADAAIEAILAIDPLYRPDPKEASPAVRKAFTTVRQRILPNVVRALYADGREAFDRKAYRDAAAKFESAMKATEDAEVASTGALADFRVLSAGFLELSRAALGQTAAAPPGEALTEPVSVRQEMPQWTFSLASAFYEPSLRAVVDVEIDPKGDVINATIVESSHPQYNSVLAKAAMAWKYEPARRNGEPVKTHLRVDVLIKPK
jgi:TonB family protein